MFRGEWKAVVIAGLIICVVSLPARMWAASPGPSGQSGSSSGLSFPKLPNPFVAIGQGLKKIGDGLASLVPHKSSPPERSQFYPPGAVKKQEEKKSFFDRLFKPKEQPKKIESVYDWMGQEQVLP
ncbi:hypothetical protein [Thermogutta sp.]|uniref:hypothetical protein n=1 Tax=Thermogutta sp. TaxID=1962930 RepID=UPI003C7E1487